MGNVRAKVMSPLGIVAAIALIAVAALVAVVLTQDDFHGLPMPDPSGATSAFIEGEPVWVVASQAGVLVVISADSPDDAENKLAWCPSSRTFKDLTSGSEWTEYGEYIWGPALRDLSRWNPLMRNDGEVVWTETVATGRSIGVPAGPNCTNDFDSFVMFEG